MKRRQDERGRGGACWAILLSLLAFSCATLPLRPGRGQPSTSISISSGPSLLAAAPSPSDGIFSYHGVDYRVIVRDLASAAGGYAGQGTVYGLNWPQDIAGTYSAEPGGAIWRNRKGVEIDLTPPPRVSTNSGQFEIDYKGPALPRQP